MTYNKGCGARFAKGQWFWYCGETDMGSMPSLCIVCGGEFKREDGLMVDKKKDMAYSALVSACTEEISKTRSNIPSFDKEWLANSAARGDAGMLGSYGAMISGIRKHSTLADAQIKYQLDKDDRVISRSSGAGTCKVWWPKGLHVELGLVG